MADLKKKRKFQCPNCNHWVKFEVNPESTLIPCDHCGQLTRVTIKTSEPLAASDSPQEASDDAGTKQPAVLSEAFDDLDLEGLEHSQYVKSKTLSQVDIKAKAEPAPREKTPGKAPRQRPKPSTAPAPQTSQQPDAGLSAPIPPPFVPAPPPATGGSTPETSSSPPPPATPEPPSEASYSAAPVPTPLVPQPPQAGMAPAEPTDDFFAIPPSHPDEPNSDGAVNKEQPAIQWAGKADDDVEILDLAELEEFSAASQPEPGPGIPRDTDASEPHVANESVRIICKICDTLNYFPKSDKDEYICQDCYSVLDGQGRPKSRVKPDIENVDASATPPTGDEIDQLISTAIDKSSPGDSWHNEGTTRLVAAQTFQQDGPAIEKDEDLVESPADDDLVELNDNTPESSDASSESGELRLAPLEAPTDAYRDSVMPQGFADTATDETQGNTSNSEDEIESTLESDETDALPELLPEVSEGDKNPADNFRWKEPPDLSEATPYASDTDNEVPADEHSEAGLEITDEAPADDSPPVISEDEKSASVDNKSLFLDGGDISPAEVSGRPGQPHLGGRVNVPVPPPFPGAAASASDTAQVNPAANAKTDDSNEDSVDDPFANGWLGNWLPVVTSSWILLEAILLTVGLSILMSLGHVVMTPTFGTGVRIASSFGVMVLLPITLAVWSLLTATIIEGKEEMLPWKSLTVNQYLTHLTRLGFCAFFSMPGMVLGSAVSYPVTGTLVSMLYTSPLALLWITMCELSGQGIIAFDKAVIDRLINHRELIMSAIAVLGMAGFSVIPFGVFAGFLPFPGIFTFAPMLVVFSVIFAIQIRRLVVCLKALEGLDAQV